MSDLTHFDKDGRANMVDVGEKAVTTRIAVAQGFVRLSKAAFEAVKSGENKKGDVMTIAELAGIMGAKKTSDLIPLCHPLPITSVKLSLDIEELAVKVTARVKTRGQTGVEMEALTAVSVACLTVYDMLKAVDKSLVITDIALVSKSGGKSDYQAAL